MRRALWPVTQPLTCDDSWRIREASGERLEIIDGELFAEPPAAPTHQLILGDLFHAFYRTVELDRLGDVFFAMLDVRLAMDTVVLPDLMVILIDRREIFRDWGLDGAPSLLAEIAWGHTDYRDRGIKKEVYALYGVAEYWLVDCQERHVTVFTDSHEGHYRCSTTTADVASSVTMPAVTVNLSELFAPRCHEQGRLDAAADDSS